MSNRDFDVFNLIEPDHNPDAWQAGYDRLEDQLSQDEEWAQEVFRRQHPTEW